MKIIERPMKCSKCGMDATMTRFVKQTGNDEMCVFAWRFECTFCGKKCQDEAGGLVKGMTTGGNRDNTSWSKTS